MFNVCMKTVNEFCVFLTGLNGWMFFYELGGCGILQSLILRYRVCFEQGAPWHQSTTECRFILKRVYMWHDKNTQLKHFCRSTVLSNYFIHSTIKASLILHGGTIAVAPSKNCAKTIPIHLIRKSFLSFKLFTTAPQAKWCLPN